MAEDAVNPIADSNGSIRIVSPIPLFPKHLALQYRNFNTHYTQHAFNTLRKADYERAWAGSALISALLYHYFPANDYRINRMWPGSEKDGEWISDAILEGCPVVSTLHHAVTRKDNKNELVAVFAVVIDSSYFEVERMGPLRVADAHVDDKGVLTDNEAGMEKGAIVLLSGTKDPLRPAFEFYAFGAGCLVPVKVNGGKGTGENILGLEINDVEAVDKVLRMILGAVSVEQEHRDEFAPVSAFETAMLMAKHSKVQPDMSKPALKTTISLKTSRKPSAGSQLIVPKIRHTPNPISPVVTGEYIKSIRKDSIGRLYLPGQGGRHVPAVMLPVVYKMAKEMGHTFPGKTG